MQIWHWVLTFRLLNALVLRTSFSPDEYWQSLEVAHKWVFGYGHLTWEWEPCIALRGVLHPGIFAIWYAVLGLLGADHAWLVAYGPRLLQGAAAAVQDMAVYRAASGLFGSDIAHWALVLQLTSWFHFFCLPRTVSSSAESVLSALALDSWLGQSAPARQRAFVYGALGVALRPTAAAYWLGLVVFEAATMLFPGSGSSVRTRLAKVWKLLLAPGILISVSILLVSSLLDCCYYGTVVLVPWNFLRFNLLHDGGAFYGSHPWHWYFTEGLAVTCGTFLPAILYGAFAACRKEGVPALHGPMCGTAMAIVLLSRASHKEYRFLLPFLPLCSLLAAAPMDKADKASQRSCGAKGRWLLFTVVFLPQLLAALFFGLLHQRGPEKVMQHLRASPLEAEGAFFLTPCHATPLHSFLHRNVSLDNLDCSPGYGSPRDHFFKSPLPVLALLFPDSVGTGVEVEQPAPAGTPAEPCLASRYSIRGRALPQVFVVWGSLLRHRPAVEQWLEHNGFSKEAEIADGWFGEGPYGMETSPSFLLFRKDLIPGPEP